jgi:hypothetical protein
LFSSPSMVHAACLTLCSTSIFVIGCDVVHLGLLSGREMWFFVFSCVVSLRIGCVRLRYRRYWNVNSLLAPKSICYQKMCVTHTLCLEMWFWVSLPFLVLFIFNGCSVHSFPLNVVWCGVWEMRFIFVVMYIYVCLKFTSTLQLVEFMMWAISWNTSCLGI